MRLYSSTGNVIRRTLARTNKLPRSKYFKGNSVKQKKRAYGGILAFNFEFAEFPLFGKGTEEL